MELNGSNIKQELSNKYFCEICDYKTNRKSNIDAHMKSAKHIKEISGNKNKQNLSNILECEICHKIYQTSAGLWKHKKKCVYDKQSDSIVTNSSNETTIDSIKNHIDKDELILMLIKQNAELVKETSDFKNIVLEQQSMMMKVIENGTHNTTHTNSHNKAFNLQFFLNETCKNAMNITDFVESIQYQLSDFEKLSEIGYVAGISDLIVKNLNALDVTKRPVHCTDKKRETIYIKDQDKWEKDDDNNSKIRKVIKKVAFKNARLINKFTEKYPEFREYNSKYSTQYHKLIIESFGDSHGNEAEKEDKIIRNITKNVVIDK